MRQQLAAGSLAQAGELGPNGENKKEKGHFKGAYSVTCGSSSGHP